MDISANRKKPEAGRQSPTLFDARQAFDKPSQDSNPGPSDYESHTLYEFRVKPDLPSPLT